MSHQHFKTHAAGPLGTIVIVFRSHQRLSRVAADVNLTRKRWARWDNEPFAILTMRHGQAGHEKIISTL